MRKRTTPCYDLTDEDLDDLARGAPDTSVSTPAVFVLLLLGLVVWLVR